MKNILLWGGITASLFVAGIIFAFETASRPAEALSEQITNRQCSCVSGGGTCDCAKTGKDCGCGASLAGSSCSCGRR
jgi:hypothetical protein